MIFIRELFFPKNDFYEFYKSGLDEHGVFSPALADRSLLFNLEHPDESDSLRNFGVDDGEGFVQGENRWRFIGAYLVYGQWKKMVLNGIRYLSAAYVLTGDTRYAHQAGILLDRVADLYPDFEYGTQGMVYEFQDLVRANGYVTLWHDACEETRELALAYDMIFDAIRQDTELVNFLKKQAKKYKLANSKNSFLDIQRNIESNILLHPIKNRPRIESNFPKTDMANAIFYSILDWEKNKPRVMKIIDKFITKGTKFDGLSGEKGLEGYSALFVQAMAKFFTLYQHIDAQFLPQMIERYPELRKTFRFHLDTWVNGSYYPKVGDGGVVGKKTDQFVGVRFKKQIISEIRFSDYSFCSMYSFFWSLFQTTGDTDFVKILFKANGEKVDGLPFDLLEDEPETIQQQISEIIKKSGSKIETGTFNKTGWCLAFLTSGKGENKRTVWLNYGNGGNHCHADGMNIGLFAFGLDLLPGFGYPPVQFGGWHSDRAIWYRKTASHNTIVADSEDQIPHIGEDIPEDRKLGLNPAKKLRQGKTTLWGDGKIVKVIRAKGDTLYQGKTMKQYERTVALIDLSEEQFYVVDIFRVVGGKEHVKYFHGYFGEIATEGLNLQPIKLNLGERVLIEDIAGDSHPAPGWKAIWKIDNYYGYLPDGKNVYLQYTDFTPDVTAAKGKAWVAFGFDNSKEAFLPSLVIKRTGENELSSTFVGILEAFEKSSAIRKIRRLKITDGNGDVYNQMNVALEIELIDGKKQLIVAMDAENVNCAAPSFQETRHAVVPDWGLETDAEFALFTRNKSGEIEYFSLANGSRASVANLKFHLPDEADFMEAKVSGKKVERIFGRE